VFHGATAVLPHEYWDPAATLKAVEKYTCTGLYGVTTMFVDQLSHPTFTFTDRSSLRFGMMAGSSMPEDLLKRVMSGFPIPALYTNWGMTELSSVATMTTGSDPVEKKMRTAGRLLPNFNAKIVEPDTGKLVPWGQRGEIVVEGFGVMTGYYQNKEQTAKTIKTHVEDLEEGQLGLLPLGSMRRWMHTGDEGYWDDEGYIVITGRIKDLIIRGGENISPIEIESRLYDHPAVKQAVVFGVPSTRYGEDVAAMLELKEEQQGRRPTDQELKSWVRQTLARYKVPAHIWWLGDAKLSTPAEWPKTANGKLRKIDVRKLGESKSKTSLPVIATLISSSDLLKKAAPKASL
jgi:mevalonyl-CoA ligase